MAKLSAPPIFNAEALQSNTLGRARTIARLTRSRPWAEPCTGPAKFLPVNVSPPAKVLTPRRMPASAVQKSKVVMEKKEMKTGKTCRPALAKPSAVSTRMKVGVLGEEKMRKKVVRKEPVRPTLVKPSVGSSRAPVVKKVVGCKVKKGLGGENVGPASDKPRPENRGLRMYGWMVLITNAARGFVGPLLALDGYRSSKLPRPVKCATPPAPTATLPEARLLKSCFATKTAPGRAVKTVRFNEEEMSPDLGETLGFASLLSTRATRGAWTYGPGHMLYVKKTILRGARTGKVIGKLPKGMTLMPEFISRFKAVREYKRLVQEENCERVAAGLPRWHAQLTFGNAIFAVDLDLPHNVTPDDIGMPGEGELEGFLDFGLFQKSEFWMSNRGLKWITGVIWDKEPEVLRERKGSNPVLQQWADKEDERLSFDLVIAPSAELSLKHDAAA